MAYLDDPYHATSIFIFYVINITGASFLIITYRTVMLYYKFQWKYCNKSKCCKSCWFVILVSVQIILFMGLMVTLACFIYFLPIDKSITKAPNQIFSFHQIIFFLIGAFVLYKGLGRKDNRVQSQQLHTEKKHTNGTVTESDDPSKPDRSTRL